MASKSTDWRPGPTVCRCCLSEGCYKDISTEYFWMGKREVYSEMLLESFNLSIAYSQSGGPNSNSRLICEPCISRLRDATEFKRQVQECEKTFMQYLDPGSSAINEMDAPLDNLDSQVKVEEVKLEKQLSDDDFDDQPDFGDDDDDDDLDDQPLTKFATKVPKKESVDLLDLLDNAKATEKRKSSSKTKSTPAKKAKMKKDTVKATSSKAIKPEKKKKAVRFDPARANAEIIIRCTTAYPFRVNDKSMLCVYCHELFDDPDVFRTHMDAEHQSFSIKVAFYNLPKPEFIKADLTNLKCRLCSQPHNNLETIANHLAQEHEQKINFKHKLGVMPYTLHKDSYYCAVCEKNCPSLFHLNRHTIQHFLSYVCHVCGASYVATTGLLRHVRSKHQEYQASCKKCGKIFPSMDEKDKHRRLEKSCFLYRCQRCNVRFANWKSRKRHMEVEHGQSQKSYRCADCNVNFNDEGLYYKHYKLLHSQDCLVCKYCGTRFLAKSRLQRHLSKHVS